MPAATPVSSALLVCLLVGIFGYTDGILTTRVVSGKVQSGGLHHLLHKHNITHSHAPANSLINTFFEYLKPPGSDPKQHNDSDSDVAMASHDIDTVLTHVVEYITSMLQPGLNATNRTVYYRHRRRTSAAKTS